MSAASQEDRTTAPDSASTLHSDIAATLKDSAGLYKLSKKDLEKLVASVIREEGFAEMVSSSVCCLLH